ncbi:MAG: hypothetical protein KIT14_22725 [bacterium]|nr:hypothetical protein [bacterium]
MVNPDSDSVGRIDAATHTLVGEYRVGDYPRTISVAGGAIYVANQGSQDLTPKPDPETVMKLDPASGAVLSKLTTPFGCAPYGVLFNEAGPNGPVVYVSCERRQSVLVLDAALSEIVATIPLDWPDPRSMALTEDKKRLYVAHFLTRLPGADAHVTEIDTETNEISRVIAIPPDMTTCETINSGKGVYNVIAGLNIVPSTAPANVRGQLWVGAVLQNNLTKGLFRNDPRFGGRPDPMLCSGGVNHDTRCLRDGDCPGGTCTATFQAIARNLYKPSFHDITRSGIAKIDLGTGQQVGKIDIDEANQPTDIVFSPDGVTAYVVDQFFNSYHVLNTARGQDGNMTTAFAAGSRFGPGGAQPDQPCRGGAFLTASEAPFILPPQGQIVPIGVDPQLVGGGVINTGLEYTVATGRMRPVPDAIGTVPHGVAISPDGSKVFVANFLSRNVSVVKADQLFCPNGAACQTSASCAGCAPRLHAVVPSIDAPDPLPAPLLDGKILFHTAARDSSVPNGIGLGQAAPRYNRDDPDVLEPVGHVTSTSHDASYVACASCHPDGGFDGRSWDFSQFGASVRNTMELRGRASFAPGMCSDPPGQSCTTDSQCANHGVGTCSNDPSVVCELDIQCGSCSASSPTPGITCRADRDCGGTCSNDATVACQRDGDCGGFCRENGTTPCTRDNQCRFGCSIANTCNFNLCETKTCNVAKCRPGSPADIPGNVTNPQSFFNPMLTAHWNADRDEVEDFEFTFRSLMGAGDCDGVEDLPEKCIGALVMRSNVAKPQEAHPDLGPGNRGLSPRLDHVADYLYSLTTFVRNPNLENGPSADAVEGGVIFAASGVRCLECHNGPSPTNQHFSDKKAIASHPPGLPGGPDVNNPFLRHNVGTFNAFDQTDPFQVASEFGIFQNSVAPIPATRGPLLDYVTPTIVDAWNTGPYNHDGAFDTLLHGILPCSTQLDDCTTAYAGKNLDNLHGTTTNLTPQQLRKLAAFLNAPHNPGPGTARLAADLRLDSVAVKFGRLDVATDDKLELKVSFRLPPGSRFDVAGGFLSEAFKLTLADVDEPLFERTIPAGTIRAVGGGGAFTFSDQSMRVAQGIKKVTLKHLGKGVWQLKIKGRALDLGTLDKNFIQVAIEIGDDAFVRSRAFQTPRGARTFAKIVERRPL